MSVRGARILLTGGAGFVGFHLGKSLIAAGASLTIVDNFDDFYDPELKRANVSELAKAGPLTLFEGDICGAEAMEEVYRATRPDVVVHLAAKAGVRPSLERPLEYERVNVSGTLNLLELARRH